MMDTKRLLPADVAQLQEVRRLFDETSSLSKEERQARLAELSNAPQAIAETLALLDVADRGSGDISNQVTRMLVLAQEVELDAGDHLGPWRLLKTLGTGGMGTVFLAERADGMYRRQVAIKLLSGIPGEEQALRLQFERQLLAGIQIPNIARMYDGGATPSGKPYVVMEFVEGIPLDQYCEERNLSMHDRIELFMKICRTVRSAHQQMIVHCDLKPSNVLVDKEGTPVLLDFGIARLLSETGQAGELQMFTPGYAAPELIEGGVVSSATDVFSLGVILLEILSGRRSARTLETARQVLPMPSQWTFQGARWQKALRGDLDAIVVKACALDAEARYPAVASLMSDIENWQVHRPVSAREGGGWYRVRRLLRRRWEVVSLSAAATAAAVVFVIGLVDARNNAERDALSARETSDYLITMFGSIDPRERGGDAEKPLTARELLDVASGRVEQDLRNSPLQRARMQAALGMAYQNLGVAGDADRLLQSAADAYAQPGLDFPADRARVLAALSLEKTAAGNGAYGVTLAQTGLDVLDSKTKAGEHARLAYAMGVALTALQRFPEAETWLVRAQTNLQTLPVAGESALRADVQSQMALLYWRWGRLAQAEQHYRELLAKTPTSAIGLNLDLETRLGQVMREAGRFAEAKKLLENGLVRAKSLYGPESRFVLLQNEALADLYVDMGDYRAAEQQFREQLRLVRMLEGPESMRESMVLHNFAWLQAARGNAALAEEMFRKAWLMRSRHLGRESTTTLRAESGLARFLISQGRLDEGRIHLAHVASGLTAQLPVDAPALQEVAVGQVQLDILEGRLDAAQARLSQHRQAPRTPQEHLNLMALEQQIAVKNADQGRIEKISLDGLTLAKKELGAASAETARWRLFHAQALQSVGKMHEAALVLAPALPVLRRQLASSAPELAKAKALSDKLGLN